MATSSVRLRRFSGMQRLFHLAVVVLFMVLSVTGLAWMFIETRPGQALAALFGGYAATLLVHRIAGLIMLAGFVLQIGYLIARIDWGNVGRSLIGPDSIVFQWRDLKDLGQHIRWMFGLGKAPHFERWSWWEKFDYWGVWWGLVIVGVTGLLIYDPVLSSDYVPGWLYNVSLWVHRIEALLAMGHIFTVHYIVEHFRPGQFPISTTMFDGGMTLERAREEHPAWVERLEAEGRLGASLEPAPPLPIRVLHVLFGGSMIALGIFLVVFTITNFALLSFMGA